MDEFRFWASGLAAVGHLTLAVTALVVGRKSALARPIAALCFCLFGWNFATLAHHLFGATAFSILDSVFTALSPALVLDVVLVFVGAARRYAIARALAWVAFGGLSAVSLGGFLDRRLLLWLDAPSWSLLFLASWLPTIVLETILLVRYLGQTSDAREKSRARIVLAALAVGASFSMADVAHGVGLPLPYLGALGTLVSAGLLSTLAVRMELFDRNVSARTAVYVAGMIAAFVVAYLVVFRLFAESLAVQAFATAVVTLLVLAVARELSAALGESRARTQRLAALGRFAAQMSHDLKGPLSALIGAAQVLEGSVDEETKRELLGLVSAQARRVTAIVDRYDRMARVEPRKTLVRVDEVVRAVARAHGIPDAALRLASGDVELEADRDLLESAVENVVRNAVEATRAGGDVRIETSASAVRVIDSGVGMDARARERAFEDFFTTKPEGSGLGLAFVRRVMLAHDGDVTLTSQSGKGTTVELRFKA